MKKNKISKDKHLSKNFFCFNFVLLQVLVVLR